MMNYDTESEYIYKCITKFKEDKAWCLHYIKTNLKIAYHTGCGDTYKELYDKQRNNHESK